MMDITEAVEKYIKCHELSSASACDGACYECEFNVSETPRAAMEKLHEYSMENIL